MTSHSLSELAGSHGTLLHMLQRAAGGRHGRHLISMTSYLKSDSVNRWQSCQISTWSDLKRRNLRLFLKSVTQQEEMSRVAIGLWDQFLIQKFTPSKNTEARLAPGINIKIFFCKLLLCCGASAKSRDNNAFLTTAKRTAYSAVTHCSVFRRIQTATESGGCCFRRKSRHG